MSQAGQDALDRVGMGSPRDQHTCPRLPPAGGDHSACLAQGPAHEEGLPNGQHQEGHHGFLKRGGSAGDTVFWEKQMFLKLQAKEGP